MRFECEDSTALAKRMLYLAWQAGKVVGMGVLQDKPGATEDDVWLVASYWNGVSGDYIFGRMMKINFEFGPNYIEFQSEPTRPEYQSWGLKYPTYKALAEAGVESLKNGDPEPTTDGSDHLQAVAIMQGIVPTTCTLPGMLMAAVHVSGEDPCAGCNEDRYVCRGRPKTY